MRKIHKYLHKKSSLYKKWHNQKISTFVHIIVYVAVTVLFWSLVYVSTQLTLAVNLNDEILVVTTNPNLHIKTNTIVQLAKSYEQASSDERSKIISQLTKVILERRNILKQELKNNPKAFLTHILPQGFIKQMPAEVQSLFEQEVELEGTLQVAIGENFETKQSKVFYNLEDKGKRYNLNLTQDQNDLITGTKVKVRGIALDEEVAVEGGKGNGDSGSTSLTITSQATAAGITGPQKTIVILFNFQNDMSQPWTKEQIAQTVFFAGNSSNEFHQENSFDKVSFQGDVVGWYTIPYNKDSTCDYAYTSWMAAADQAATKAGVVLSNYDRKLYYMNSGRGYCNWGGFAQIGGATSWAFIFGYNDASITSHELGHNLGAHHASSLNCGTKQIDTYSNCSFDQYGDRSDVMGNNWYSYTQFNALRKSGLGWYSGSSIQTVNSSGMYTITPTEINDGGIKALKIAKPDTGESYYVSYRQPIGFDTKLNTAFTNGASIHIWSGSASSPSRIIDTTNGDGNMYNAALMDDSIFSDPVNGVTIKQLSHTSSSVIVDVQFPPPICSPSQPSMYVSPASLSGSAGIPLVYTITVTNNDSSACSPSIFTFGTVLLTGWIASYSSASLTVAPRSSGTIKVTITPPSGTIDGAYNFTVSGKDNTGRTLNASATYISFTDTIIPNITITNPQNGATVNTKKPTQVKVVASDSSGIQSITISVDGKMIATCTNTTSCSSNQKLTAGIHTITASAIDKSPSKLSATTSVMVTAK